MNSTGVSCVSGHRCTRTHINTGTQINTINKMSRAGENLCSAPRANGCCQSLAFLPVLEIQENHSVEESKLIKMKRVLLVKECTEDYTKKGFLSCVEDEVFDV